MGSRMGGSMPRSAGRAGRPVCGAEVVRLMIPICHWMNGRRRISVQYLPHSRSTRDWPRSTARRLPKELSAMRKLRPRTAPLEPKTFSKNRLAAICVECWRSVFETVGLMSAGCTPANTRVGAGTYRPQSRQYLPIDTEWRR